MIELLHKKHNKKDFDCGNEALNDYIRNRAGQDVKRKLAACFVLCEKETQVIQGYYTLSNNSIPLDSFLEETKRKLPRSYTSIPTTLLGRLAIDVRCQNKGIGKILLIDALKRSYELSQEIGSFAVVVDPIDENAEKFYTKFGFIKLPDSGKMLIAMKTLQKLFE